MTKSADSWSHLLEKFLMENFIFCAVQQELKVLLFQNVNLRSAFSQE